MSRSRVIVVALTMLVASSSVSAQDQDQNRASFVPDVVKKVILDPTTYAPAIVAWEATRLDWRSSQIFFQNGSLEHNARFTVSGRSDDTAIGYAAGNRQILTDAIANLQLSLVNSVSERVMERLLMRRYPKHRKLLRARSAESREVGWRLIGPIGCRLAISASGRRMSGVPNGSVMTEPRDHVWSVPAK